MDLIKKLAMASQTARICKERTWIISILSHKISIFCTHKCIKTITAMRSKYFLLITIKTSY